MKQVEHFLEWLKIQKVELSDFKVNPKKSIEDDGLIALMPVGFAEIIHSEVNKRLLELQNSGIKYYQYFRLPKKPYKSGVIYQALQKWNQAGVNPLIIDVTIELLKQRFSENPNDRIERVKLQIQNLIADNNEKITNI